MSKFAASGQNIIGGKDLSRKIPTKRELNQKNFIDEANKIMRERMKNKGSTINSKARLKSVILNDTKEISLKNYLIDLLKKNRTSINEKERNIAEALKNSENTLDEDAAKFASYVEEEKRKQKEAEAEYTKMKRQHQEKDRELQTNDKKYKTNLEEMEKTLRNIYRFKTFGVFIHKVLDTRFPFELIEEQPELKEDNVIAASEDIIQYYDIFEQEDKPYFEDDKKLMRKFAEKEELIIKGLDEKQKEDKEIERQRVYNEQSIVELKRRREECEVDYVKILEEKKQIEEANKKIRTQKMNEMEQVLSLIEELKNAVYQNADKRVKKVGVNTGLISARETLDKLKENEKEVNDLIKKMKYYEEVESHIKASSSESKIFKNAVDERKNHNKSEKQQEIRKKQQDEINARRARATKRAQKVIIKGRKVPQEYPIHKEKKKKDSNIDKNEKQSNLDMLYY